MITYVNTGPAPPIFGFQHQKEPLVTPLGCDYLSCTLKLAPTERKAALNRLKQLKADGTAMPASRHSGYKFAAQVHYPADATSTIRIHADPADTEKAFLRFETNPLKVAMSTFREVVEFVTDQPYEAFVSKAVVTRFDATVDAAFVNINEILIRKKFTQATSAHHKSGHLETTYYGSKSSRGRLAVYDKRLELKRKNASANKSVAGSIVPPQELPPCEVTRIEYRHKKPFPLYQLGSLENLFSGLSIYLTTALKAQTIEEHLFLESARYRGLHDALKAVKNIDKPFEKKMRAFAESAPASWWKPDKIWKGMPTVANAILNPDKAPGFLH